MTAPMVLINVASPDRAGVKRPERVAVVNAGARSGLDGKAIVLRGFWSSCGGCRTLRRPSCWRNFGAC
jgi:hypothetical protein